MLNHSNKTSQRKQLASSLRSPFKERARYLLLTEAQQLRDPYGLCDACKHTVQGCCVMMAAYVRVEYGLLVTNQTACGTEKQ